MNRERYQLVFSRARGCLVAVGEGARRMGKQGSGQGRPARASLVQTTFASFAFAAALLGASPIQAQLVADPAAPGGQRATVLAAPNGVPLVNITTPSAAGVSRNTWRRFDVGAPGAILNNSRSDVTTQLGGWVQGNPWLAAGSARVILNEVNSAHPSQLKGWVEVAGPRAEVVIANPAGIQVNGAGFINASGVTLTTGAPVFNAGALEAYRVQGGQVTIEGSGLDARGADATAVLARAVQVNAGLWAQRLTMVTGANTVAASGPAVPAAATPAVGDVPAFALDVAQIGGMYAGHIHLVGTEAGLGVNNRGLIAADAGHLTLAVNGQLTNHGAILAAGDMALRAAQLLNEGTAQAPAVIGAGDALALEALRITNRGTLQAHSLHARADTLHNRSGGVLMADRIAIEANEISNRPDTNAALAQAGAPVIAAHDDLQFGVHTLNNEDGALLYSGGNTGIGGSLDADGKAIGQAHSVNNLSATIEAMGELTLAARTLTNERRNVEVTQTTVIDRSAQLSMPAWWVNGKNEHNAPIASTSNHTPYRYYLLDPASILSEELLITPDGNRIRRVEVALEPSDSIHYAASGAYGGQYGVQRRLTVGSPTTAVLYVQERRDGVANPDQVNGATDVFAAHTREVHTWQQDTLSYSSTWGRCTTNCTLLVVQPGYSDPMADLLRNDQTYLMPTHPGLELSRSAHHTALQDRLNTDAGAPAALRAGAGMQLHIGESLTNRHADILAGGALDVIAPEATVHNEGHTLKRTHHFAITSHTAGLGDFEWTKPEITETLGELGGRITSAAHLNIQALDLTNTDHARASGLASNGLSFVGVSLPGEGAPLVVSPNSLLRPAPPNHNVLFETDPRFTQHRSWLGSDYLLDQLAHNPDTTLKRLGDGWQEQKLVREQVAELTGRRYLAGHASDEAQFRALMDAGLAHAQALELKPGIALSAEQVAQLTTDLVWLVEREVVLPSATGDGQRTTALVPQVYLRQVPSGELQSSGALIAGQQAVLDIGRDLTNTGARIEGDVLLAQAGRDITNIGGLLQARSELLASAGRHVTIASPTHTTRFTGAHAQQSRTELAGVGAVRVTGDVPGARLTIKASEDVVLQGAAVGNASAAGSTTIDAGRNVQLQTVSVGSASSVVADARNWRRSRSQQELGTDLSATGDLRIRAGNDLTARAASVQAGGDLTVQATQDIHLQAARAQSESASRLYLKRSGPLSKKSTEVRESRSADVAVGSGFGGANVVMEAGRDVLLQGSEANARHLLLLDAGRDVHISAEQNHESGAYFQETKRSGLSVSKQGIGLGKSAQNGSGNFSAITQAGSGASGADVLIAAGRDAHVLASTVVADDLLSIDAGRDVNIQAGVNRASSEQHSHSKSKGISLLPLPSKDNLGITLLHDNKHTGNGTRREATAAAGTVGSLGGDVAISAAQRYRQSGSDVLALAGNVDIEARHIDITEARETRSTTQQHSSRTLVIGATPRNALIDTIKGAQNTLDTAQATTRTGNSRIRALGAAATALNAVNTANQVAELMANPEKIASVTIDFNLGTSKSRSDSSEIAQTGRASTVAGAGDVRIIAKGAGADSDIAIRGSDVSAGKNVLLKAEGDVRLESAQDSSVLRSRNDSSGASIGVGISFGASNGITLNASANKGEGHADGQDITQRNTHIVAGGSARIESGADTALAGAVVSGETVQAEVGGNLLIQSRQDSSRFKSDQHSAGVGVSLCIPPICYGASSLSASGGAQNIQSAYASVTEQSGLQAGDGGFLVNVQGDTTLKGGAITSTDKAVEDGSNRFFTGGELALSNVENHARYEADGYQLSVAVAVKGAEPTTPAQKQLAPATPAKTEGSAGIGEDSGEVRSTTHAAISGVAGDKDARTGDQESGIAPIFDQQRVQAEIDAQIKITAEFGKSASTAWGHYANQRFTDAVAKGDEETASCWAPDGACRAGGHALIGGLSGGAAGAAGAGLSSAGAPHVQAFLVANGVPEGAAQAITQLSALGAGIAAGGNAGAAAGFNEASNNAVQALPLLMEAVVSGGAVAARACLSSPTCLSALRLGGTVLVAKVATLVPPEELAQMPGFGTPNPGQIVPHTERPAPVPDGNSSTMTPGTVVDSKGAPPSQGNVPLVGGSSTLTPGVVDGTGPTVVISEGVPTAILDGKGRLPIGIGGLGTPIPMPSTSNPNQTAEEFAKSAFNGQTPTSIAPDVSGPGSWLAKLPDGTSVLYRPAGLGSRTDPTTASVDVNSAGIRAINNGVPAKFKFPRN